MCYFARLQLVPITFVALFDIWVWSKRRDGMRINIGMTFGVLKDCQ